MHNIPPELLQKLDVVHPESIRALDGNANKNYLVSGPSGQLVIKQLLELTASEAQTEGEYRALLHAAGLPVSKFHILQGQSYVYRASAGTFVVADYADGLQAQKTPNTIQQVAGELARIHLVDPQPFPTKSDWFAQSYVVNAVPLIDDSYANAKQQITARAQSLPNLWADTVPVGIVHGDLHIDNFVMSDHGTVAAVLDWENTSKGPIILDVAHSLRSLAFTVNECNQELAQAFLEGYQAVRPLAPIERSLLLPAIHHSALLLSVWAHIKFSQKGMKQELFDSLKDRYTLQFSLP